MKINYLLVLLCIRLISFSQNETRNWYFGNQAGLSFATSPPTVLTNGQTNSTAGSGSISDANGNLLFYTNGGTVWDKTHAIMANGTGLFGNWGAGQGPLIVKMPGSLTQYYIFTANGTASFGYSIIDMSLAAGNGSVVAKNVVLSSAINGSGGKITGTKHCNGVDVWVVTQDWNGSATNNNSFRAYLVTTTTVNPTPVISSFPMLINFNNWNGSLKLSPNGKKLACVNYNGSLSQQDNFQLYDFDNTTGVVSNYLNLWNGIATVNNWGWGCEFSPDGTKLYGTRYNISGGLFQWDLCAGSPTAIVASQATIALPSAQLFNMQVASDGKIYVARWNQSMLGVINNPNALGTACNYVDLGQTVAPKICWYGFPNYISSYFVQKPPPTPFTHTVSNMYGCQGVLFNSAYNPSITVVGCSASGYSLTGLQWNFGDPASGASNISTLQSPTHAFTTLGTYSVQLVLYYSCGGGTDTLKQVVNVNQPCISVSSTSITCASLGSATVSATGGTGPFSYTWMPTGQTNSVATGLTPGSYTLTVYDFGTNFTYTASTLFTSLIPLTGNLNVSGSITCNGASTGTANVTNLAGGSNNSTNLSYLWFNGATSITTPTVNTLSAGIWSLTVTDTITGCQINDVFFISQPPAMTLNLSTNSPTTCAAGNVTLTGLNSGGTPNASAPAYTYTWTGGPGTATRLATQPSAGIYIYTLTSRDFYNCSVSNTISIDFIANPVLSVGNTSICPLQTGMLNVSGASSYTWNTNLVSNVLTDNPLFTTQYSVVGSALGCTSSASAYIILKPVPFPIFNSNSPVCEGKNLNLLGYGGISFQWDGPLGFTSSQASPVISNATPNQSGAYSFTVTAINGCTASITKTLTVGPIPTITAVGSTVCVQQAINLMANSFAGASYTWTGPSFNSGLQNPSIASATVSHSGNYTVKVASANGCTNSAVANVTVTAMPQPAFTSNSPRCFGTTLSFTASGGDTYSWTGPNSFNSSSQNPVINNITVPGSGVYNLQVTRGPCVNTISHSVVVNPLPVLNTIHNSPICETKSLSLSANAIPNAIYQWKGPLGFLKNVMTTGQDSCKLVHSGFYTLTVIDANSCKNTHVDSIQVISNPTLTPVSTTVCLNAQASLSVSGAATYFWSGPTGYQSSNPIAFIPSANSSVISIYTVVGKAANNCTAITQASLTTLALPLPSLQVFPGTKVCFNQEIRMQGSGGDYYQWKGPSRNYSERVLTFTASSPFLAGTYTLIVTDKKGCSSFTTTSIDFNPLPDGDLLGSTMDACVPFHSDFQFYSSSLTSTNIAVSWLLKDSLISGKSFSRNFKVANEYIITGIFKDTLTGCSNTSTFVVNARPIPKADFTFTPERPVEGLDDVVFTNTSLGLEQDKWNWFFINNAGYRSENKNTSYIFNEAGAFPIAMVVKNIWGCADTIVKEIRVEPDFNIYVPNIFSPNEDGHNEVFMPVATGVKFYELQVFNRWGKKMFQSSDLQTGWDGSFNGEPCKSEVYVWKIKVSAKNGEAKELTGHVTLYR